MIKEHDGVLLTSDIPLRDFDAQKALDELRQRQKSAKDPNRPSN